ncbi:MAG: type II toxin-antitoxin system HicB family antitoxin [Bacteroidetes bacterium]|nr:type II toxin-antitoxin system HicB family antitoxin [Bacteroidota bacterium]
MLLEYIQSALNKARYEIIDDEQLYYGEVPLLKGVWAQGKTLEECRTNLKEVIEGWLIVRLEKGLSIPPIGNYNIENFRRRQKKAYA